MAEGFANSFNEDDDIKITASVDKVSATQFDQDFGNIPFKAGLTINFSNQINEKYLSASAKVFLKGTAEIKINANFDFGFKIVQEKVKVQSFTPYFLSDTDLGDFEEEFLQKVQPEVLKAMNREFKNGVYLPLGAEFNLQSGPMSVTIYKDYILVEQNPTTAHQEQEDRRRLLSLSSYTTFEPSKESTMLQNYPVTWTVDQDHKVTRMGAGAFEDSQGNVSDGAESNNANNTCKGKGCNGSTASSEGGSG